MHYNALRLCTVHVQCLLLCSQRAMVDLQVNKPQQQCLCQCVYAACWKQAAALNLAASLSNVWPLAQGQSPSAGRTPHAYCLDLAHLGKLLAAQTMLALTAMAPAAGAGAVLQSCAAVDEACCAGACVVPCYKTATDGAPGGSWGALRRHVTRDGDNM